MKQHPINWDAVLFMNFLQVIHLLSKSKGNQVISFPDMAAQTYGAQPFTPHATASAGLPVSFESSDLAVAKIENNNVVILKSGLTYITATQSGDDNSNAAGPVGRTLVVKKVRNS